MPGNPLNPNAQPPAAGTGGSPDWLNALMSIWPDYMAGHGIEPPADAGVPALPQPVPPDVPIDPTIAQPIPQPMVGDAIAQNVAQQQPPVQDIQPQNNNFQAPEVAQPQVQVPDENLFPTEALAVSPQDMADATAAENPAATSSTIGKALSGVEVPAQAAPRAPDAPAIPQTKPVDSNLLAILKAAGLAAPQVPVGMGLGQRF